ncbi:MAG: hypothetical protein K2X74_00530 [Acetobacteraceae bacterium]|nr:hypothetical protein [Acetobacteraceae bacterium]
MALQQRTRLYEFLARVDRVGGADRVVGMQVARILEIYDDQTQAVVSAQVQPAQPVDWAGLVALMHEDDIAALVATLA